MPPPAPLSNLSPGGLRDELDAQGFLILGGVLAPKSVEDVLGALASSEIEVTRSRGVRNLVSKVPAIAALSGSQEVLGLAELGLDAPPRLVRSILFDKVAGANWAIRWHQDKTIAVRRRIDVAGYGPWSVKEGIASVQPPARVLERMVSIRLHLDDCGEHNGALQVLPGSHRSGKLTAARQTALVEAGGVRTCTVGRGGALLMKPLLLHASSPAIDPSHRRVVHFDYAGVDLDGGLEWSVEA